MSINLFTCIFTQSSVGIVCLIYLLMRLSTIMHLYKLYNIKYILYYAKKKTKVCNKNMQNVANYDFFQIMQFYINYPIA